MKKKRFTEEQIAYALALESTDRVALIGPPLMRVGAS